MDNEAVRCKGMSNMTNKTKYAYGKKGGLKPEKKQCNGKYM